MQIDAVHRFDHLACSIRGATGSELQRASYPDQHEKPGEALGSRRWLGLCLLEGKSKIFRPRTLPTMCFANSWNSGTHEQPPWPKSGRTRARTDNTLSQISSTLSLRTSLPSSNPYRLNTPYRLPDRRASRSRGEEGRRNTPKILYALESQLSRKNLL